VPLQRVRIRSVRCLAEVDIELAPGRNYLYGSNGAGKTSLLESIHLLGRGRSFRTRHVKNLLRHGATELTVVGDIAHGGLAETVGIRFAGGHLEIHVGGVAKEGLEALARRLPVHVIDPQQHELVEGGPSVRRRYLDGGVFHVEPRYLDAWRGYRRVLAQRNSALKQQVGREEILTWNHALTEVGHDVHAARERYFAGLSAAVERIGRRLLAQELTVSYRRGWDREMELGEALASSLERDLATGYTQVGPHRADMSLRLEGAAVRDAASRGQQKLVVAALVLAQVGVANETPGPRTTLLVDDPAAELDRDAVGRLLQELWALDTQLVLTGLSRESLEPARGYALFHVEQGRIKAML
jgi:DNA replication and repair protein RecF